jgi:hypothetical protein
MTKRMKKEDRRNCNQITMESLKIKSKRNKRFIMEKRNDADIRVQFWHIFSKRKPFAKCY